MSPRLMSSHKCWLDKMNISYVRSWLCQYLDVFNVFLSLFNILYVWICTNFWLKIYPTCFRMNISYIHTQYICTNLRSSSASKVQDYLKVETQRGAVKRPNVNFWCLFFSLCCATFVDNGVLHLGINWGRCVSNF